MLLPFVHQALLSMDTNDDDVRGPGAAVTLELCGSWDHEPPCPLAAHHTTSRRDRTGEDGHDVVVRVVFACAPAAEADVRARIDRALRRGAVATPDGGTSRWTFRSNAAQVATPQETEQAGRLSGPAAL
jgi:hypothetical protein